VPEDGGWPAEVAEHHGHIVAGSEQRPSVGGHHRIVVHVDHVHARREPKDSLGQLVHVGLSRKAAAEIEELPDPALGGQVPDHPAQERPLVPGYRRDVGNRVQELPGCLAVGGEIVLAARMLPQSAQETGAGIMDDMLTTDYDGCGRCLVGVRRLSRKTDATSSPQRQADQILRATADAGVALSRTVVGPRDS
jgi:hypothetical protein